MDQHQEHNAYLDDVHHNGCGYRMSLIDLVPEKVIQAILRHSNVSVTMTYHVKELAGDVRDAMATFEENYSAQISRQNLQDSDRTLEPALVPVPESVN